MKAKKINKFGCISRPTSEDNGPNGVRQAYRAVRKLTRHDFSWHELRRIISLSELFIFSYG